MEIDITHMIEDADTMPCLAGSVAELGSNAGPYTWSNSKDYAKKNTLLSTDAELEEARQYFKEVGFSESDEMEQWSTEEINALLIQFIASNIRKMNSYDTEEEYQEAAKDGRCHSNIFKGDNGRWYFYMGT